MSRPTMQVGHRVLGGNVAPDHAPCEPGEFQITAPDAPRYGGALDRALGIATDRVLAFGCPRRPGHACAVLLKPHVLHTHDGVAAYAVGPDLAAPTLAPGMTCSKPDAYGCRWQGALVDGVFHDR